VRDYGLKAAECRSCRAPIAWVKTARGKNMPIDLEPTGLGTWLLEWEGEVATAHKAVQSYAGPKYTSHFSTCPDADKWRAPK
jgi:hypothetical protein